MSCGDRLRPFVEKKIVEYLGVMEEMLVDVVEGHLKAKGGAGELVEELAEVSLLSVPDDCLLTFGRRLDDDAEDLVKKLWRMVIFFTECAEEGFTGLVGIMHCFCILLMGLDKLHAICDMKIT